MSNHKYGLGERAKRSFWWLYPLYVCLAGIIALSAATQQAAAAYGYQKALGLCTQTHWYLPWSIIIWMRKFPDAAGIFAAAERTGQLVFILPQMAALFIWHYFIRTPKGKEDIHGTAHWAKQDDIQQAGLLQETGVYVGGWESKKALHYLRHNGPEHILAFAPTRSGKGVGLVLPTLLSWRESALILDIKGENWALTSGWRQKQGQRVLRFEPTDPAGTAARFNPLEEIRLGGPQAIPDTQNIASMIVDPDGKGLKDYWNKAAFALLGGAILHCMIEIRQKQNRTATLNDLGLMLADPDKEVHTLLAEMLAADHTANLQKLLNADENSARSVHTFIASSAREMLNKADNELSGVVSTAVANLALYRDPVVAANTSACDFRIDDLMQNDSPVSLYLVIRPSDIDRLRPLVRLILNVVLRRLTERMEFAEGRSVAGYKHRLLLMMDEFTSLGRLEIFERSLAFMAGYGLKAYFIVQDLTQLQAAYSKEESIMSNCHVRIAYAPNKVETAKVLSEMTGKITVTHQKTTLSGNRSGHLGRASVSISETARPLLTPDECMRLPGAEKDTSGAILKAGDMLIFPAGFAPIYGKQILYFLDPVFTDRAKITAPKQSDRLITVDRSKTKKPAEAIEYPDVDARTEAITEPEHVPEVFEAERES